MRTCNSGRDAVRATVEVRLGLPCGRQRPRNGMVAEARDHQLLCGKTGYDFRAVLRDYNLLFDSRRRPSVGRRMVGDGIAVFVGTGVGSDVDVGMNSWIGPRPTSKLPFVSSAKTLREETLAVKVSESLSYSAGRANQPCSGSKCCRATETGLILAESIKEGGSATSIVMGCTNVYPKREKPSVE